MRPQDFAVIDGLIGVTDGPSGYTNPSPNTQLIIAGRDSVAVDSIGTLIMGYNPDAVHHLQWAYNRELGTMDRALITVKGDHVDTVRTPFGFASPPQGVGLSIETEPPWITSLNLRSGQVVSGAGQVIAVSNPCVVSLRGNTLYVCDPTQTRSSLTVTIDGTPVTVSLPSGGYAGQQITIDLAP